MFKIQPIFILFVFALFAFSCTSEKPEDTPTNIIVIFTDDMGYGDLGCYGHPNISTPNIDKMAGEGMRFTSFYAAASVCTPSRAGLLTGRYPIRNAPNNFGPESTNGLPLDEVTIADVLKTKGYATMAIGKWHLGHKPEYLPTSRGFDHFYGLPYSNDMILPWCPWLTENDRLFMYEDTVPVKEIGYDQQNLTVDYTHRAVQFIGEHKEAPFFLYLAHSMPHLPISTSGDFIGKSKGGLYGDVVETLDWSVGEILKAVRDAGIDENTLIVFTSDNGPWQNLPDRMLQRGVEVTHSGFTGILNGAKATTYEGGLRVPGIMRWPGKVPAGTTERRMATTMDLLPTFADITGAKLPEGVKIDGQNILPLIEGGNFTEQEDFFYFQGTQLQAVRKGAWKLSVTETDGTQLFNLDLDPAEKFNVASYNSGRVQEMYNEMRRFAEETDARVLELN